MDRCTRHRWRSPLLEIEYSFWLRAGRTASVRLVPNFILYVMLMCNWSRCPLFDSWQYLMLRPPTVCQWFITHLWINENEDDIRMWSKMLTFIRWSHFVMPSNDCGWRFSSSSSISDNSSVTWILRNIEIAPQICINTHRVTSKRSVTLYCNDEWPIVRHPSANTVDKMFLILLRYDWTHIDSWGFHSYVGNLS